MMKLQKLVCLCAALLVILTGCAYLTEPAQVPAQAPAEEPDVEPAKAPAEEPDVEPVKDPAAEPAQEPAVPVEDPVSAPEEAQMPALQSVLVDACAFVNTATGETTLLKDFFIHSGTWEAALEPHQFAILDLDEDGAQEAVISLYLGEECMGYVMLDCPDAAAARGYYIPQRGYTDARADGTFLYSGGAQDNGIGRYRFGEAAELMPAAGVRTDAAGEAEFFIGTQVVDADTYTAFFQAWEVQEPLAWTDWSLDAVNAVFAPAQ